MYLLSTYLNIGYVFDYNSIHLEHFSCITKKVSKTQLSGIKRSTTSRNVVESFGHIFTNIKLVIINFIMGEGVECYFTITPFAYHLLQIIQNIFVHYTMTGKVRYPYG